MELSSTDADPGKATLSTHHQNSERTNIFLPFLTLYFVILCMGKLFVFVKKMNYCLNRVTHLNINLYNLL